MSVTSTYISRRWLLMVLRKSRDPQHRYACGVMSLHARGTTFLCEEDDTTGVSRLRLGEGNVRGHWIPLPLRIRAAARKALCTHLNVDRRLEQHVDINDEYPSTPDLAKGILGF